MLDVMLKEDKLDAVVCVAGGWAGGNTASEGDHPVLSLRIYFLCLKVSYKSKKRLSSMAVWVLAPHIQPHPLQCLVRCALPFVRSAGYLAIAIATHYYF